MKRAWIFVLSLLLLLFACGCGGGSALPSALEQDSVAAAEQLTVSAAETLLADDYEIYYLVYFGGLELDYGAERDGYYAVSQEGFGTRSALRARLLETYTESGAQQVLDAADAVGRPLFAEYDGALYRSGSGSSYGMIADYDDGSIAVSADAEGGASISVREQTADGTTRQASLPAQRENGVWKLAAPRIALSGGAAAAQQTPRAVAQEFLLALTQADTAQIERAAGEAQGSYASWKDIAVDSAALVETLEETDGSGRYIAALSVQDAYGLLLPGESRYRIIIESVFFEEEDAVRPVVVHFQPESVNPYNYLGLEQRDDAACEQVMCYLELYGAQGFGSAAALSAERMTDFSLSMLDRDNTGGIFTKEQVAAAMAEYFGTAAQPEEDYYSAGAGGYIYSGREAAALRYEMQRSTVKNGVVAVRVDFYTDHLQTKGHTWLTFTLSKNASGSYQFLSAK